MGITRYENLLRDYKAAGGQLPDVTEQKEDLVNMLPQEIRENLLWRASGKEKFNEFKNHIETTANSMLYHRGKVSPINRLDDHGDQPSGRGEWDETEFEEAINGVMKRFGKGVGKRLWRRCSW